MKTLSLKRDSELQLWRFALALMGGRAIVWMFVGAVVIVLCALVFVTTQTVYPLSKPTPYLGVAKMCAVACFLALPLAAAHLYAQCRLHPLLHLMPNGEWRLRALLWRIVVLGVLLLAASMYLQMFLTVEDRTPPGTAVSLATVEPYEWRAWLLFYLGAAAFIWFGASSMRVPLNFVWAPAYMFSMQMSLRTWWIPLAAVAVFMGVPWLYQRFIGDPPKRVRMLDDNVYMVLPDSPATATQQRFGRWQAWRLRRVLRAPLHKRVVALASMSQATPFALDWLAALQLGFAITFFPLLSPAVWGHAYNMMLGMIALFFVIPGPVTLAPLWLLPVGVLRDRWGELLVAIWMRRVRVRIVWGLVLGIVLLLAEQVFLPHWEPSWSRGLAAPSLTERYLVAPLLLALTLHGVAYTAFALAAMWPPANARGKLAWIPPIIMLLTPIAMGFGLVAADAVANAWMPDVPATAIFVVAFGVLFPLVASALLRTRRGAWARVDIATISSQFSAWGLRVEARVAFDQDVRFARISR